MSTELLGKLYVALKHTGQPNPEYTGPALSWPIAALGNEVTYSVEGTVRSQNTSISLGKQ